LFDNYVLVQLPSLDLLISFGYTFMISACGTGQTTALDGS